MTIKKCRLYPHQKFYNTSTVVFIYAEPQGCQFQIQKGEFHWEKSKNSQNDTSTREDKKENVEENAQQQQPSHEDDTQATGTLRLTDLNLKISKVGILVKSRDFTPKIAVLSVSLKTLIKY